MKRTLAYPLLLALLAFLAPAPALPKAAKPAKPTAKSPVYSPLQRQLNGVWRTDIGTEVEIRNGAPGQGAAYFHFPDIKQAVRHEFRLKGNRLAFPLMDTTYTVRIAKGANAMTWRIPKGRPGHSNRVRTFTRIDGSRKLKKK
ncbi:MAG: hypothetical protein KY468_09630 [Armatimonadetes bacterium]|nr:hypothetical protein [Armatimonadota bacterium]